ncbi:MAG: AAA family ATPase [Planctomycetes bacterium]|nr:AAA family ATPase [Planctomycetota bacterium]
MDAPSLAGQLAPFTPEFIRRRLAADPRPLTAPLAERWQGAALVADVSGFTTLAEKLAEEGAVGAERLTGVLDEFFGRAIECIEAHGGDVARFAGDALLVIWTGAAGDDISLPVRQAAACALNLQEVVSGAEAGEHMLSMKIGLGAGSLVALHVGGFLDRWDYLISGVAFQQAFAALRQTGAGETAASLQAWKFLQGDFRGAAQTGGVMLLEEGPRRPQSQPAAPIAICEEMGEGLRSYIPAAVIDRLSAGHGRWLGELRVATVLFVSLPELNYATPLAHAQQVMQYLQQELYRYEGAMNKLNVDDKGTALLAAFGLPPLSHEDDPRRGVAAALAMQGRLRELGLDCSLGISTGRVFCGALGGPRRREYTLLGDVVNRAARLMQTAVGDILCDDATRQAAERRFDFESLPDVMLKGRSAPLAVFRPAAPRGRAASDRAELIGRAEELSMLSRELELAVAANTARVVMIEGEPGVGKTRLLEEWRHRVEQQNIAVLAGQGDALEMATLYFAWRPVFQRLFEIDTTTTAAEVQQRIAARMRDAPELADWAPLVRAVLPIEVGDNNLTTHMSGRVRGENLRRLLAALLEAEARRRPVTIVLDDVHCLDSASAELAEVVSGTAGPLLLVLAQRLTTAPQPASLARVHASPQTTSLQLAPLAPDEATTLACRRLGCMSLPQRAVDLLHRRAEGNPLFVEELALALRDSGQLEITEGMCRLTERDTPIEQLELPETLHGAVTSRLDRLAPPEQLTVKVASVIGRRFPFRTLYAVYPVAPDRPRLRDHLGSALRTQIIAVEVPEPDLTYLFRSVIAREAAYQLLLFHQREELHREVARWRESAEQPLAPQDYGMLAYHWRSAGRPERAVEYLEKAGQFALDGGAYQEAINFYREALHLDDAAGLKTSAGRLARWEQRLGEAYLGLGRLSESRSHLLTSLTRHGHPAPRTRVGTVLRLAAHAAAQAVFGARSPRRAVEEHQRNLECARAYESLAEIYYLSNDKLPLVHALLANLRFAQAAGPSAELAKAYANNCISASFAHLHPLARRYAHRAKTIAREADDPATLAWVLEVTGLYALGVGKAADVLDDLAEAAELCRRLGDWRRWGENMATLGQGAYYCGQIKRGFEAWDKLRETAAARGDELQHAWGLNGSSEGLLRLAEAGAAERAIKQLTLANELYTRNVDRISQLGTWGLLAWVHTMREDANAAREAIVAGLRLADEIGAPTGHYSLAGYANFARASLWLWEHGPASSAADSAQLTSQSLRGLRRYARVYPIGRPTLHLYRGASYRLRNRPRRAIRQWRRAVAAAKSLNMPSEEAAAREPLVGRTH